MQVILDNRENKSFIDKFLLKLINIPIQIKNLDIGDIHIIDEHEILIAVFERKTINDLMNSLSDGRYHEQKARLLSQENPSLRNYYIFEGSTNKLDSFDLEKYKSCFLNTI